MAGIFTSLFSGIDTAVNQLVGDNVANVIGYAVPIVGLAMTLSLMVSALQGALDPQVDPLTDLIKRMVRWAMILGFVTAGGLYQTTIVQQIQKGPDEIASVFSSGMGASASSNFGETLDAAIDQGHELSQKASEKGHWYDGWAYAMTVGLATDIFAGIAGAIVLMAKIMLSLCVIFGPAFIFCLMFDSTKHLFSSWVGTVINYTLITVMVAAVFSLLIGFFKQMVNPADPHLDSLSALTDTIIFAIVAIFTLLSVPALAGRWSQGVSAGFGQAARLASSGSRSAPKLAQASGRAGSAVSNSVAGAGKAVMSAVPGGGAALAAGKAARTTANSLARK